MADFDFGNLFYLLAIILFAVFGSRKKKKPTTAPTYETEKRSEPNIFEQLFQEEVYSPEPEHISQEHGNDWHKQDKYATPTDLDDYHEKVEVEEKSLSNKYYESIFGSEDTKGLKDAGSPVVVAGPTVFQQILGGPFDLRKAVIYSEILKRRSY